MKIVTVIPLKKGTWKEELTYFSAEDVPNGSLVTVPLRSQKVLGLVIDSEDASVAKSDIKNMTFNLKKITEVKEHSIFLPEYLEAALDTSKYFAANKSNGITTLLPAVLRENYDKLAKFKNPEARPNVLGLASHANLKSEKFIFQAPLEDRLSAYKTLIRGSFASKKSVYIVLPTEHDLKMFEESLSKGIEQFTFSFHAGQNAKKIIKKFEDIISTTHPVLILGTAPYLSVPRSDIDTIILEHESSSAYRMIGRPHFDLRFFTELFTAKINAKFILADTLLRFETIARQDLDSLVPLHPLYFRTNFEGVIEILGRDQTKDKKFKILTDESILEIKNAVAKNKSVFIFSLRKGLATTTICRDCGNEVRCEVCGSPQVLYLSHQGKKRMFVCNRCERDESGDTICKFCGSWNLMPLGIGTDTVYEYVKEIFADKLSGKDKLKIYKLDKDSAKTAKGAREIIKEFEENPGSILVATEMAFFYLQNEVSLSVIASFDSLWSIPNFKMGERIIHIIISMIERTTEKFIIQTKNDTDPVILAIRSENLLSFVREELEDRRKLNYPPFKRFIKITHLGDREQTIRARKVLQEIFEGYSPEIFSGFVAKLKDKYATNALIKLDPKKWSLPEISSHSSIDESLLARLLSLPMSFQIFVDPEDLL